MICGERLGLDTLLLYWFDEIEESERDWIEEHLLGCDVCTQSLQHVVELGEAIRIYTRRGWVMAVLSGAFVQRLADDGVRLREYRVAAAARVLCTLAPRDQVVVAHLEMPLAGIDRLDLLWLDADGREEQRLRDVPFAPESGALLLSPQIDRLRALPATTVILRAVAMRPGPERIVGDYTFIHTPWNEAPA